MSMPEPKKVYEKVIPNVEITGLIDEIKEDKEHKFPYKDKETGLKTSFTASAVRFIFTLDGSQEKHGTRWMKFSYDKKYELLSKYMVALVEGANEEMLFDIQDLVGMQIKTVWEESENGFQSIKTIEPELLKATIPEVAIEGETLPDENVGF